MISKSAKSASPASLLDELQSTLAHGTVARRVETLRRVTDLFIGGASDYSSDQVGLFDDVFQYLIDHIETSAKMLLANRLAPIDTAPPLTIRALAFDDVIEVAGPVLSQSTRLDDKTLIENARSKSQAHLMAISTRKTLSGAVTDVLVQRGNNEVVQSTVNNPGAEFTESGFTRLVDRAEGNDDLAASIGLRPTMPRHLYLKLLAKASNTVRQRLEAANPQQAAAVLAATDRVHVGIGILPAAVRNVAFAAMEAATIAGLQSAYGVLEDHQGCRNRPRADQIAVRGRPPRRTRAGGVRQGREIRRGQCLDRSAGQRAGGDRREHDDRKPRRGRDDFGEGRRAVLADGQDHHQDARQAVRRRAHRPFRLPGYL